MCTKLYVLFFAAHKTSPWILRKAFAQPLFYQLGELYHAERPT